MMTARACRSRIRAGALHGYTIVELMMSLAILAIGTTGIFAMQHVTLGANQRAKNLAVATHVAQAWADQLSTDAAQWNHPSTTNPTSDLGQTRWLVNVGNGWFRPAWDNTVNFGPAFDALGNVVNDTNFAQAEYCTHIRLDWLVPERQGNGLIRAEVRVFWVQQGGGGTVDGRAVCDPATSPSDVAAATSRYHFVYATTAIRQNKSVQ